MRKLQKCAVLLLAVLIALCSWSLAELDVDFTNWEPLERGSRGEEVEILQELLIRLGFLEGDADGSFGPETERALIIFQTAVELEPTGIADAETMEALTDPDAPTFLPEMQSVGEMVWILRTGQRYHRRKNCSGMKTPSCVSIDEAIRRGFTPCKKC